MIDRISAVYAENNFELLWLIGPSVDCDKNWIWQWCDWSYKCGLCWKWNRVVVIDRTKFDLFWKWENNNVTDRIDLVYVEVETKLAGPIWSSVVYDENQTRKWLDRSSRCIYDENDIELSWLIRSGCQLWWKLDRRTTWLIVQMRSTPKTKLSYCERLNHVQSMMKTKQDNDMTDRIWLLPKSAIL